MLTPYTVEKDGKTYMYRATSRYSPEKRGPVAVTEYMGVVVNGKLRPKKGYFYNEETGEFGPVEATLPPRAGQLALRTLRFGDTYLLMHVQKRLGLLDDLIASFGDDLGRRIMASSFAYSISKSALMHIEYTMECRYIRQALGLPSDADFSSPRMSELTKRIGQSVGMMERFFSHRVARSSGEYVFDLTSESTYSIKNTCAEYGKNRDHDRLRQINMGLVTDRVGRPLMFHTYPGSVADVTTLRRMVDDVRRLGGEDFTLVLDRGFESLGNISHLLDDGVDFVMPMIIGDEKRERENKVLKSLVTDMLEHVGRVEDTQVYGDRSYTVIMRQLGVRRTPGAKAGKRDTTWEDEDGYELVTEMDEGYANCDGYVDMFVFRDTGAAGAQIADMDVALKSIMGELEGSRPKDPQRKFERTAGSLKNMLGWEMGDEGMHVWIKQNAHTFASNRKGVFIMATPSSSGRGWKDVLTCYECRDIVEDVFLQDKSEGDGRVPRSGDRETIVGRTFVRMVSTIMEMDMFHTMRTYADDKKVKEDLKPRNLRKMDPQMVLGSVSNVDIVEGEGWKQLTEVTKTARLIYRMFGVDPPEDIPRRRSLLGASCNKIIREFQS